MRRECLDTWVVEHDVRDTAMAVVAKVEPEPAFMSIRRVDLHMLCRQSVRYDNALAI